MAKVTTQKTRAVNGPAAAPPPESIEQVRDLLFGGQMRMVDARIQSLDERLVQQMFVEHVRGIEPGTTTMFETTDTRPAV